MAKSVLLQTADLTGVPQMSTEGGEARLYLVVGTTSRLCKMEVELFGETGKAVYLFTFGPKLVEAVKSEYRYQAPIYVDPDVKSSRSERITLTSREGRATLRGDFALFKTFFRAGELRKCSGRQG